MSAASLVSADRPVTIPTQFAADTAAFASAKTVASIDDSCVPSVIHRQATDAIKDTIEPWIAEQSSKPGLAYKWWCSLPMSVLGFKARDDVKAAGADAYVELTYLEAEMARRLSDLTEKHRLSDPAKGYKSVLKEMRKVLKAQIVLFRADREAHLLDLVGRLQ